MSSGQSFVHLHVHSDYSLSMGASKVADIVKVAAKSGIPALALTDVNNMYGAMEFSKVAAKHGVQPIIGAKLYFPTGEKTRGSVIFLAQSERGYINLCTIMSHAYRPERDEQGHITSSEPLIPVEQLLTEGATDDLIVLSGGKDGILNSLIRDNRLDEAAEMFGFLGFCFGDRFYVEVCRNGHLTPEDIMIEEKLIELAYEVPFADRHGQEFEGAPLVATSEVYYATPDRHDAFELLHAVETKGSVSMTGRDIIPQSAKRYYLRNASEMAELFKDMPEAVRNAVEIAKRCAFKVEGRKPLLPPFPTEGGRSEEEELRDQATQGLHERFEQQEIPKARRQEYLDRLDFELNVINQMGFPGYFLIVSDFMRWAIAQDIPVGPGRGSGAGSVVAWSLKITDLDPLQFGLLFERFLNPERVSMPDFDIDFCQDRRGEVIQYVQNKYGVDKVSSIVTFLEIKSKTALKDVGRVITHDRFGGYSYGECDQLSRMIPKKEDAADPKTLMESYKDSADFRERIDSSEKNRVLLENACKIEGLYRSSGVHAAGIIIGGLPLHTLVPMGWDDKADMPVCQFNMKDAEAAGLVKFDFLGLKTLSVIKEALRHIRNNHGRDIDISTIPLDDPEVFRMLAEGRSTGVFQLESEGMRKVLRQVKPSRIDDVIAVNALYRPGPMSMIPHYAACNTGEVEPHYPEPVEKTRPFLEETHGIMVYQEQVMLVAQVVAGYSLGGADLLRRAMGKKIPAEMAKQRSMFVEGAVARGTSEEDANELFDHIAKFAGYGFNKSHAAAYAVIAYRTAWLKRYYPEAFFSALLSYETKPERMALIKDDMDNWVDKDGNPSPIEMLSPCVNNSHALFTPEKKPDGTWGVRLGLAAIKQIPDELPILIAAREKGGPFKSLQDFHKRAGKQFNRGQLEKLAEAGAFETISENRYQAFSVLSWLAKHDKEDKRQSSLFDASEAEISIPDEIIDVQEWGNVVDREFNSVGFYFHMHPIKPYKNRIERAGVRRKNSIRKWMLENGKANLPKRKLCVLVDESYKRVSGNGNEYINATVSEQEDTYRVMFFGSEDFPVEKLRVQLEAARLSRKPIIIIGDVVLEEDREGATIFGKEVWDIDIFLADVRGDITFRVDPESVVASGEEQKLLEEAKEARKNDYISEEEYNQRVAEINKVSFARKMKTIKEFLYRLRDDSAKQAVTIRMEMPVDGNISIFTFPGKYVFTPASENSLKAMDGVVSVKES